MQPLDFKNAHILIVDDQPINAAVLKKIVSQDNAAKISLASGGREALVMLKNDPPDLVLMDILMPEMDGFEVCEKIKKDPATRNIPVIFITSLNDPESISRGFDCGGIDYILKPFNSREVLSRVRAHLGLKLSNDNVMALSSWKDRLISILSHDMRGPFSNLVMYSEIMEKELDGVAPYFSSRFKDIKNSIDSVCDMMENLLQWSRAQSLGPRLNPEAFKIKDIIDACIKSYAAYAADKKISLKSDFASSDEVFADRLLTEIILRNLIRNAIKFTASGEVVVKALVAEGLITITVADTGVGIEPETLSRLLERSQPYSTSGTIKEKGSGIGLMICKDLAAVCGGKITANSRHGIGSEFSFTFPGFGGDEAKGMHEK